MDQHTRQQEELAHAASELLGAIQRNVPESTAHWAVEQARQAAFALICQAETIHTHDHPRYPSC